MVFKPARSPVRVNTSKAIPNSPQPSPTNGAAPYPRPFPPHGERESMTLRLLDLSPLGDAQMHRKISVTGEGGGARTDLPHQLKLMRSGA